MLSVQKKEMMMRTGWVLMILLFCMTSHASQSPAANKDQNLQILCIPAESHEPLFVPCPKVKALDVLFKLLEDKKEIYSNSPFNLNETIQDCNSAASRSDVDLCRKESNNTVGFILNGTAFKHDVIYTCEATIRYPPPYKTLYSDQRAVVLKKENHYFCSIIKCNEGPTESSNSSSSSNWIWIIVVALLSIYGSALSITALVFWMKLRQVDSQNDYMNAKPVAPQKRKKKKGVNNPIPKHF